MEYPDDATPSAKVARIVYHLLLRQWTGLPGFTTQQAAVYLGMSWAGVHYMLNKVLVRPELPVRYCGGEWGVLYGPRDIVRAPVRYTVHQRSALVTQRLICRYLIDGIDGISVEDLVCLLGMTPRGVEGLMESASGIGGVPTWEGMGVWYMLMDNFDCLPQRRDIISKATHATIVG